MKYLRNNYESISKEDFQEIDKIYEITHNSIHYFKVHKVTTFNLNAMVALIRKAKKEVRFIKITMNRDNEAIRKMQMNFQLNYLNAVYTYTPFLKARISIAIAKFLIKTGIKSLRKVVDNIIWLNNEYKSVNAQPLVA